MLQGLYSECLEPLLCSRLNNKHFKREFTDFIDPNEEQGFLILGEFHKADGLCLWIKRVQ